MSTSQGREFLYGAASIAEHLGLSENQVFHLQNHKKQVGRHRLPTFKMGARVCARVRDLDAWMDRIAKGAVDLESVD